MSITKTVGTYDFRKDLAVAVEGEKLVAKTLADAWGWTLVQHMQGMFPDYDLEMQADALVTVEVKSDLKCSESGNVAIELGRVDHGRAKLLENLKPSGVASTKADLVAYLVSRGDDRIAVHIGLKQDWLDLADKCCRFESWGGDGNRTHMSVVRYEKMASYPGITLVAEFTYVP